MNKCFFFFFNNNVAFFNSLLKKKGKQKIHINYTENNISEANVVISKREREKKWQNMRNLHEIAQAHSWQD